MKKKWRRVHFIIMYSDSNIRERIMQSTIIQPSHRMLILTQLARMETFGCLHPAVLFAHKLTTRNSPPRTDYWSQLSCTTYRQASGEVLPGLRELRVQR